MHNFWQRLQLKMDKAGGEGGSSDDKGGSGSSDGGAGGTGGGGGDLNLTGGGDGGAAGAGNGKGKEQNSGGGNGGGDKGGGSGSGDAGGSGDKGGSAGSKNWREDLPEAIRGSKSLEKFANPAALAQSYISLEQAAGKKGLVIPQESAPKEEWDAFHKAMGRPDSADKYDIKPNKDSKLKLDDGLVKEYKEWAHEQGLNPKQAANLFSKFTAAQEKRFIELGQKVGEKMKAEVGKLRTDWGDKFETKLNEVKVAITTFTDEADRKFLEEAVVDGVKLANHPAIARIFAKVAGGLEEDKFNEDSMGNYGKTLKDLESELAELSAPSSPRFGKDEVLKEKADQRVIEIRQEIRRLKDGVKK